MTIAFRIAAVQLALLSIGFGTAGVLGLEHFSRTGSIWRVSGFASYDPVGFEQWGVGVRVAPSIIAFIAACVLGVIAAVLLWIRRTAFVGAILAIIATAMQAVFWAGFVLPFGPPGGAIVIVLVVVGLVLRHRRKRLSA